MKVPVRCGIDADAAKIQAFKPDFVVVATGSVPKAPPMDTQALASDIAVMHAWDVFIAPECIAPGTSVTVIGGGMVGVEVADLLRLKGCDIQVLEMQATAANGMARNNKFELLERIAAAGVRVITQCRIESLSARHVTVKIGQAASTQLAIGQVLIFANGPRSNTEVVAALEQVGVPYALVGDCHAPGDFLSAIRDGWMVALGIDQQHFSGKTV
jgi:pyruvate/2-oxoglutarate dehydrogenase complex dihydrolipoamide dehydrogenase (E3) component